MMHTSHIFSVGGIFEGHTISISLPLIDIVEKSLGGDNLVFAAT